LHLETAEPLDFFDAGRRWPLGDGHGQHAIDEKQRQNLVFLEEIPSAAPR
jgi:hypothetical protein